MNCLLFAKMDIKFSVKKQNIKKALGKMEKILVKSGKVRSATVNELSQMTGSTEFFMRDR